MLSHPSDGTQWEALNFEEDFGKDPRNVVLVASTDGVNPFGNQSSTHSTWPVFVCMYNIPPWECMKRKYMHMSVLIEGPKQPGNDLNLYLGLLKEELDMLWRTPVITWDAHEGRYFPMKVAMLTTVHDYLGLGYVAGQVVHGHYGCARCMDDTTYLGIDNTVGLPVNRHLGRLTGCGHREGLREMHVDFHDRLADFERANLVALQHIDLVDPWVLEHKTSIEKTYIDRGQQWTDGDVLKEHNACFTRWFKDKLLSYPSHEDSSEEEKLVFALSQGAEHNLMTYQAYDINGYTFYTGKKDMKSDYQNSGVTMEAYTGNVKKRYYGRIEEIWELGYAGEKVPMFRVRWAKSIVKESRYFTTMVIPQAKSNTTGANVTAKNEPWVLASQVDQCFFITDTSKPSRVVVRRGKRNIIGMDGAANEQDFDKYGDPKIEDDDDDDAIQYKSRRSRTTLPKGVRPFKRINLGVPGLNYANPKKKGKKVVNNLKK